MLNYAAKDLLMQQSKLIYADFEWQRENEEIVCEGGFWYCIDESGRIFRVVKGKYKKIRHISDDLHKRMQRSDYDS